MIPVRLGIIGVGEMGGYHTLGFSAIEKADVVAIADIDEERMQEVLAEIPGHEIVCYTDYQELLKRDDIEAVVISVPQYLHLEVALAALEAGLDIYLEKPIAPTVKEADRIIDAHRRSNLILQVGLEYRYAGLYRKMAEMCLSGAYGAATMMWCKEFRQNFPPRKWFYDQSLSGGAMMDKNVHHFDLFNWMIDSRPLRVFGMGGQHVICEGEPYLADCTYSYLEPALIDDSTILDHSWVIVEYENGARASLGLCMYLRPPYPGLEIGAITDMGHQLLAQGDATLTLWGGPKGYDGQPVAFDEPEAPWVGHIGAHQARLEFLECVRTRNAPAANVLIGREAMAIAQAAEMSIAEDRVVYLEELD